MRILSALVLTHCFGCVIPEDSENNFVTLKSNCKNISYETSKELCRNFEFIRNNPPQVIKNVRKRSSKEEDRLVSSTAGIDIIKEQNHTRISLREMKDKKEIQKPKSLKKPSKKASKDLLCRNKRKVPRYLHRNRNLLNQKKNKRKHLYKKNLMKHKVKAKDHHSLERISRRAKQDDDKWDDWSLWGPCSVTCGTGRKIRWKHCLADDCIEGLKKAQIKPCEIKKCESGGIFKWLGLTG